MTRVGSNQYLSVARTIMTSVFLLFFVAHTSFASSFCNDSKRGWFWFETKEKLPEPKKQKQSSTRQSSSPDIAVNDAKEKLKELQEEIETRKAEMIMYPSIENTRKFLDIQNQMFMRASLVAKNGQLAVLSNPELNIAREQPISQAGLKIAREEQTAQDHQLLTNFAKQYQLLFFYSSKCIYCEKFSYVIEHYAKKYGFKVASVTTDGKQLPNFPASHNQALIERFNVKGTPALFAFSESQGIAVPISHGFVAIDLIEKNTVLVANELLNKNRTLQTEQNR